MPKKFEHVSNKFVPTALALGLTIAAGSAQAAPWYEYLGSNEGGGDWGPSDRMDYPNEQLYSAVQDRNVVLDFLFETASAPDENGKAGESGGSQEFAGIVESGDMAWYYTALGGIYQDIFVDNVPPSKDLYIQLGNEINSQHRAEDAHEWLEGVTSGRTNDPLSIPYYVEYFFAPTAYFWEASNVGNYKLTLGSVANFYNEDAQTWLNDLLSYEIQGTWLGFDPSVSSSMTGRRVGDVVDCVTAHYHISGPDDFEVALDTYFNNWPQIGCYVASEELGRRRAEGGLGYETAWKVSMRTLWYATTRNLEPSNFRALLWGSHLGDPTGKSGMEALYPVFGDTEVIAADRPDITTYRFALSDGRGLMITEAGEVTEIDPSDIGADPGDGDDGDGGTDRPGRGDRTPGWWKG